MSGSERRILMVGKSGVGTSSTGNTILGKDVFQSAKSLSSLTSKFQKESCTVENGTITVFDIPNFFHSKLLKKNVTAEIGSCMKQSFGLHALLLIFTPDTFTEQESDILWFYKEMFGEEALRYTIVLFTHEDEVNKDKIRDFIQKNSRLSSLIAACGGRYHVLNNKDGGTRKQVSELLYMMDRMVWNNENNLYTLEKFQYAHSFRADCKRTVLAIWRERPKYIFLICAIVLAMGGVNYTNTHSVLSFNKGSLIGLLAALAGASLGKVSVWMNSGWQLYNRMNVWEISCGLAAGGTIGYCMGSGEVLFSGLAALAGAAGAKVTTQRLH